MNNETLTTLTRQFETAWKLTEYHLEGLGDAECLWRPADKGLHVWQTADGVWRADWPESEGYDLGPPSIAWLTWHIGLWWRMALDHNFGSGALTRAAVTWPGSAEAAREQIIGLQAGWRAALEPLTEADLRSQERTRWPFKERPFGDVIAWLNIELTKNASEIGYARFLYAVRGK
jgi:hypothetical protein